MYFKFYIFNYFILFRSRLPSVSSRSRLHLDYSEDNKFLNSQKNDKNISDNQKMSLSDFNDSCGMYDRLELVQSCLHCSLKNEHRQNQLRAEIETAVLRLSKRLNDSENGIPIASRYTDLPVEYSNLSSADSIMSSGDENLRIRIGTPDIVVSSFSSDDDNDNQSLSSLEQTHKLETSLIKNNIKSQIFYLASENNKEKTLNDLHKIVIVSKSGAGKQLQGNFFLKNPSPDVTISQIIDNIENNDEKYQVENYNEKIDIVYNCSSAKENVIDVKNATNENKTKR